MKKPVLPPEELSKMFAFPFRMVHANSEPCEFEGIRQLSALPRVCLPGGRWAWLVTRYSDFRAILSDRRFSADSRVPGFPLLNAGVATAREKYRSFVSMDPPEHTKFRKILANEFSPRAVQALRPMIAARVDDLIEKMLTNGPPSDVVNDLALPAASSTICAVLGIDFRHHDYFYSKANVLVSSLSSPDEIADATRDLCDNFLKDIIHEKRGNPRDDLLSRLLAPRADAEGLTDHEIISLARLLLIAGYETTANALALSVLALLQNPDQAAALRRDSSVLPSAVDELLRYTDPTHAGIRRIATEDVVIGHLCIARGEGVILANASANRDRSVFDDPHGCDIYRKARHHVAFGYGVHQCLAHHLARMELEIVIGRLFQAIPDFRLSVPEDALVLKRDSLVLGLEALPITWSV
ncbi:cytochrome P450 [Agrobacterium tumefaciens]|uniref:cytochrome P450 n=1 Tax=Agrobacterium tumefaciens TaxID=358 RepID=UPI00224403D0|nr:cytochrome P450 [Agrobacterium tumefaciens]MCW8060101.1 cytochrome P450 [Agrobacterium tumefaciens]